MNATEQEDQDNIQRLELVVQRDGKPSGRALFHIDVDSQKATEFTRAQRKEYDSVYGEQLDKTLNKPEPEKSDKISHSGDI